MKNISNCIVVNCFTKFVKRGLCQKHYRRWHRHGTTETIERSPAQRYFDGFDMPIDQCWNWKMSCFPNGYGQFHITINHVKKNVKAHRFGWELYTGKTIPKGLLVCHRCDNPRCQNPSHLFLGTSKDNNQDRKRKGRSGIKKMIENHWSKDPVRRNIVIGKIKHTKSLGHIMVK